MTTSPARAGPPRTEAELRERAADIAGLTLEALGCRLAIPAPARPDRAKGWIGTLMETALGASAASRPEPDFRLLGVELKTVPVRPDGRPRESTYVCAVPLGGDIEATWEASNVRRKLARVLWLPVVTPDGVPFAQRRIGSALLWSPSEAEESILRADWEELAELVCLGRTEEITARHGTWLQVRPKGADSRARRRGVDATGAPAAVPPRGYYLRPTFTRTLFERYFAV